jgi:hypothetical protein
MSDSSRVRVTGPLSPFAASFVAELRRQGYAPGSAIHRLRLLAHLSRWQRHRYAAAAERKRAAYTTTGLCAKRQRPASRAAKRVIAHERPALRVPRTSRA